MENELIDILLCLKTSSFISQPKNSSLGSHSITLTTSFIDFLHLTAQIVTCEVHELVANTSLNLSVH